MIEIRNLSKRYNKSIIFQDTSFSFPDQGLICVLGPSGCGKSTLLNLLAGFDSDYDGDIYVHGSCISQMNSNELCAYRRNNIGFVFQNYHLLSGYTALENVLLAADVTNQNRADSKQKAYDLLDKLGISDKAQQKTQNLSGGEKQRAAIARALIHTPSFILADEPTGALDRKNASEIMELLKEESENRLVIVITHDKKCAEYAKQTVTIADGKLVAENNMTCQKSAAILQNKKQGKIPAFHRAIKNFKVHLSRQIAIGIAISISILCFMMTLSSGNIMEQSVSDFQEKNTTFHNGYIKSDGNTDEILSLLQSDTRIANSYAQFLLQNISVVIGSQQVSIEEKYPMPKATEKMSYGVMPRNGKNEIALSPSLAAKFEKDIQNLIGKNAEIKYKGQSYLLTISGIFNAAYDDFFISSDAEQKLYQDITGVQAYSISYDTAKFEDIIPISDMLREKGLESKNAALEVSAFLNTFRNLNRLFLTISILIFASGIFIGAIILMKQQYTRSKEIGLLSALGYTKRTISKIFFYENMLLSVEAIGFNGILILVAFAVNKFFRFSLLFSTSQILSSLCLTIVIILIIGFLSGILLLRTEPGLALKK